MADCGFPGFQTSYAMAETVSGHTLVCDERLGDICKTHLQAFPVDGWKAKRPQSGEI